MSIWRYSASQLVPGFLFAWAAQVLEQADRSFVHVCSQQEKRELRINDRRRTHAVKRGPARNGIPKREPGNEEKASIFAILIFRLLN